MVSSHRNAGNPLTHLKNDLLLALSRFRPNLDIYREDGADLASLEAMLGAIERIRDPLAMLEHREAVVLLDEMRSMILALMDGTFQPPIWRCCSSKAAEHLIGYLNACLSPHDQRIRMANCWRWRTPCVWRDRARQTPIPIPNSRRSHGGVHGAACDHGYSEATAANRRHRTGKCRRPAGILGGPAGRSADAPSGAGRTKMDPCHRSARSAEPDRRDIGRWCRRTLRPTGQRVCAEILVGLGHCLKPLSGGDRHRRRFCLRRKNNWLRWRPCSILPALPETSALSPPGLVSDLAELEARPGMSEIDRVAPPTQDRNQCTRV